MSIMLKVTLNTWKSVRFGMMIVILMLICFCILLYIMNNYGSSSFPKRLMYFDKTTLLIALSCATICVLFSMIIWLYILLKFAKGRAVYTINEAGITFFYSVIFQRNPYFVPWEDVAEIKLRHRLDNGYRESFIGINLINIDVYKQGVTREQNKYIENVLRRYKYPIVLVVSNAIFPLSYKGKYIVEQLEYYCGLYKKEMHSINEVGVKP